MLNKGGQKYWRTIKSSVFKYTAACGTPVACELHGWPQKVQLGALQHALLLRLTDCYGNFTKAAVASTVNMSSDQVDIRCEVGQWMQAADGAQQLQLSAVQITPLVAFHLPGAGQPMTCDVKLSVTLDRGLCLNHNCKIDVFAGTAEDWALVMSWVCQQADHYQDEHCTRKLSLYGLQPSGCEVCFVCFVLLFCQAGTQWTFGCQTPLLLLCYLGKVLM